MTDDEYHDHVVLDDVPPVLIVAPSRLSDAQTKAFFEWVDTLPPAVQLVARAYPRTRCFRSTENAAWHLVVHSYDQSHTDTITVSVMHGADSSLPGVVAFGESAAQLVPCDCGKWTAPTVEQIEATRARLRRKFGGKL